jgi:hypothetical protein
MSEKSNHAPYFDHLIHVAQSDTRVTDAACIQKLLLIINEISILKVQGEDELRRIWFEVPRGNIEDYGQYEAFLEDEVVGSYDEFLEMWEYTYPEKTKWYDFTVTTYRNEVYFFVDSTLTFSL